MRDDERSRAEVVLGLAVVGVVMVVLGGLLAAVTGPLELAKGSWAAAYLVLVAGVTQVAMGVALRRWGGRVGAAWWQFVLWNLGNAAVILGTLLASPALVFVGSAALVAALALAFLATLRGARTQDRMLLIGYRLLLVLVVVSIPVGMVLFVIRQA
ncbi:hypothetical protein [Microbacterium sp. NPDC057650]|uniref:hypothetical protein n=1 Tax=unclassified Microbacterium TaxID=2609290 RepID=UPI003671D743